VPGRLRRFPAISRGTRRKTSWGVGPRQLNLPSITANGSFMWEAGAQTSLDGITLVRLRGSAVFWLEVVTAIGDGFTEVGLGFCNIPENAFDVGVTAVPTPLTDIGWDGWLYHKLLSPIFGLSVTESDNRGPLGQVRVDIDSKAMRKTRASDLIIGVVEVAAEVGTATLQFVGETRILDKLP